MEPGHGVLLPAWPVIWAPGCLVLGRPGHGSESARQRPATYSSGTGTERTAIRFTTRADRPTRRGADSIRHAGTSAPAAFRLGLQPHRPGGNRANVTGHGTSVPRLKFHWLSLLVYCAACPELGEVISE